MYVLISILFSLYYYDDVVSQKQHDKFLSQPIVSSFLTNLSHRHNLPDISHRVKKKVLRERIQGWGAF